MNIHCSACGTSLPSGSLYCRGCGLPLTAHALPTPAPSKKAFPIVALTLGLFALVIIFLAAGNRDKHATLLDELHAGAFTTPEAFQARCGHADHIDPDRGVLRYGRTLVELHAGAPVTYATLHTYTRNGQEASIQIPVGEDVALSRLNCGAL